MAAIATGFVLWCAVFLYRFSFVAIDGQRYFPLFDDAMISMRYAWNLAHGLGLTWNPGAPVEGYTNLLTTLLMAVAILLCGKTLAPLAVQIAGVGVMLGIGYLTWQLAGRVIVDSDPRRQEFFRILAGFCALAYYPLVFWSLTGMETALLTLLLLLALHAALNYAEQRAASALLGTALWLGLAFLTRPDSGVFAVLVFAGIVVRAGSGRSLRAASGWLLAALSLYLLFPVGQTLFRFLYYGELVPNTYVLKLTGMPAADRIMDGLRFLRPFLWQSAIPLLAVAVDLVCDFSRRRFFLASLVLAAVAYQVWIGGDAWYYWRILAPVMPLVFVLFARALLLLVDSWLRAPFARTYLLRNPIFPRRYATESVALLVTLVMLTVINVRFLPQIALLVEPFQATANRWQINSAIALDDLLTEDGTVGVFWAGTIPYYTERVAVDFLGKSDPHVARQPPDLSGSAGGGGMRSVPGHNKYDLNYSLGVRRPTYAQGFKFGAQDLTEWAEPRYVRVEYRGVVLFLLKDSPAVRWDRIDHESSLPVRRNSSSRAENRS